MIGFLDRPLQRLTPVPEERGNAAWMIIMSVVGSGAGVFVGGPVLQSFFLDAGLDSTQIGLHGSVGAGAGAIGMLALMGVADRVRNRPRTVVLTHLVGCLDPLVLLLLAVSLTSLSPSLILMALIAVAAIVQPVTHFGGMVHSGLTVRVVHHRIRGRISGLCGVLAGVLSIFLGLVVASILSTFDGPTGYGICFAVALPLALLASLMYGRLVELPQLQTPAGEPQTRAVPWAAIWQIYRLAQFRDLLPANALRGLLSGVHFFAWIVGLQRLDMPAAYIGLAATVQAVASGVIGSAVIGICNDRWGPAWIVLLGSVLTAAAMVGMVVTDSPLVFLALYGAVYLGGHLVGAGVPLGSYEIVPPELMGAYSGLRLILLSAGSMISMPITGYLLQTSGPAPVFAIGAAGTVFMGLAYWRGFRRHRPAVSQT